MMSPTRRHQLATSLLLTVLAGCGAPSAPGTSPQGPQAGQTARAGQAAPAAFDLSALPGDPGTAAPQGTRNITAFPERDFLTLAAYAPNLPVKINLFRRATSVGTPWVQVGYAEGTIGADGLLEVNHPGGLCWFDQAPGSTAHIGTPDMLPGDALVVSFTDPVTQLEVNDQTFVSNVWCGRPFAIHHTDGTADVVIKGQAFASDRSRLPLDQLEQRMVNPDRFSNLSRSISATAAGADDPNWLLAYDGATGNSWTATYKNLAGTDIQRALDAEARVMWLGPDPANLANELTIYENPGTPGPFQFACAPFALNAVTSVAQLVINAANSATPAAIALSGSAQPTVTAIDFLFPFGAFSTVIPASCAPQAPWTWLPQPGLFTNDPGFAALPEGFHEIGTRFTLTHPDFPAGVTIPGAPLRLLKDVLAPDIDVTTAVVNGRTVVALSSTNDPDAAFSFNLNGGPLTAYTGPFTLDAVTNVSLHARDAAGNLTDLLNQSLPGNQNPNPNPVPDGTPPVVTATPGTGATLNALSTINLAMGEPGSIFFTLDGTTPTPQSSVFVGPIPVPTGVTSLTVRFIGVDASGTTSAPASVTYAVDTAAPVVTGTPRVAPPAETRFNNLQAGNVRLATEQTATLRWTTDGSNPTTSTTRSQSTGSANIRITKPQSENSRVTVQWYAIDAAGNASPVTTGLYRF